MSLITFEMPASLTETSWELLQLIQPQQEPHSWLNGNTVEYMVEQGSSCTLWINFPKHFTENQLTYLWFCQRLPISKGNQHFKVKSIRRKKEEESNLCQLPPEDWDSSHICLRKVVWAGIHSECMCVWVSTWIRNAHSRLSVWILYFMAEPRDSLWASGRVSPITVSFFFYFPSEALPLVLQSQKLLANTRWN